MDGDTSESEEIFNDATKHVQQIATRLDNETLLYLYARYKQVSQGPCSIPRPTVFDFQGKRKWDAWSKLGNMSSTQAMMEYIELVGQVDPQWRQDELSDRGPAKAGMGVSVSTMRNDDDDLSDSEKTVFDWCKDGDIDTVRRYVNGNNLDINELDSKGLALLHWASDRGLADMVEYLLSAGAKVNVQDIDGQTPLHYAVSCEHDSIVKHLITHGADTKMADSDGDLPFSLASGTFLELIKGQGVEL